MIRLNRILLSTDFSDNSAVATNYASALAEHFDAELHVLHVIPTVALAPAAPYVDFPRVLEEQREATAKAMDDVLDSAWVKEHRVVRAVREGTAFVEIIRYAKENNIDLIVMGTHGRSGLNHALIGSVSEKVVRKSACPVLTVRPEGHQFVMP